MPAAQQQANDTGNRSAYILHESVSSTGNGDYIILDSNQIITIVASVEFSAASGVILIPEVSLGPDADTGAVWYPVQGVSVSTQRAVSTVENEGAYRFATGGWIFFRMRLSAIGGGTISVYANWVEGSDARDGATSPTDDKITLVDEASDTITYIGSAQAGSATSSAVWRIKRIQETGTGTAIEKAAEGDYDQVWDDRASLNYS